MKTNFQIIVIVFFIALAIFGLLVFSGTIPIGDNNDPGSLGTVVLWGTVSSGTMLPIMEQFNATNPALVVKYVQKSANSFDQDLLEALADGTGPDMFFLPDNLVFRYANKIFTIPYTSYPLASFKNNFAGAGEVFLTSEGILAIPLSIDPLVMYYNRSILDANSIIYPPVFWDDLTKLVPTLTQKDQTNKIIKNAVALGHFSNVTHAKDILAAMFMQAGNSIVSEKNGIFSSSLGDLNGQYSIPDVLKFYTDFADPNKDVYSWNKSFANSDVVFSTGNLAFYFGYGSELGALVDRNPNQNFLVAPLPQIKGANFKSTGARVTGIALLSSSKNFNTAFTAANLLATSNFATQLALAQNVTPARRDLLQTKPTDAYTPVFYNSALYARSWLDPSSRDTDNIFRSMIDGVLSNSFNPADAIADANSKMNLLLNK